MNNNNNYLRELRIWLCADLKNTDGQLICECNNNTTTVNEQLQEILIQLQDLTEKLTELISELNKCKIHDNTENNNNNNNKHKCIKCECGVNEQENTTNRIDSK